MAAPAEVFDTVFKIGAVFTGEAAFDRANNAVSLLEKHGLLAGMSLKKMVAAVGGMAAGVFTVSKITGYINSSVAAARNAKAAYEGVGESLKKIPQMQKLGDTVITATKGKLKDLAEQMQKTGLVASESLMGAFSKLLDQGMSPHRIKEVSGAFEDLVIRVKGVGATAEDVASVADQLGGAIKAGGKVGADALISLGVITEEQRGKFESLSDGNKRYNYVLGQMNTKVGDTAEAMKTWAGSQQRFKLAFKDVSVAIGTPFMAAQDKISEALVKIQGKLLENTTKISESITPVISKYAEKATDFFIKLIEGSDKWAPKLDDIGKTVEKVFGYFEKHPELTGDIAKAVAVLVGIKGTAMAVKPIGDLVKGISDLSGGMKLVFVWGPKIGTALTAAFTAMGPAGWITLAIGGFIALLVLIITHWKEITEWIGKAFTAVKEFFGYAAKVVNPFSPESQKATGEAVQSTRQATMAPAAISDANRLIKAREEDAKLGPTHHEHFQALKKVIEAEHAAKKTQAENTTAVKDSTDALYGKSPGFIPGLRTSIASLAKFETSLGQANASVSTFSSSMGGMSLGAGGMPGMGGGMSLGGGGAGGAMGGIGSMGGIQVTHYGYEKKGQKDWDPNSAAGIGAYNNKLVAGYDVALNRMSAAKLGINYDKDLGKTFAYGGKTWRYGDRTAEWLPNPRFDVYDPGGNLVRGQHGGLVNKPSLALLGEKIPEMTIPLEATPKSRGLVGAAAEKTGMAPSMLESALKAIGINLGKINIGSVNLGKVFREWSPGPAGTAEQFGKAEQEIFRRMEGQGSMKTAADRIGREGTRGRESGPIHLSMSSPITINGVPAGEEGRITKEVQKAMQDPVKQLLDQLKKAKSQEQRLSYA
jgi:hypothetical protein